MLTHKARRILVEKVSRMVLPDCLEAVWRSRCELRSVRLYFSRIPVRSRRGVSNKGSRLNPNCPSEITTDIDRLVFSAALAIAVPFRARAMNSRTLKTTGSLGDLGR